ncbi:hypothetical protein [Geobacter grbiciae]|uniref:hypothetical protein n=1 Tax=Geobacter grbiciae TaxID=155042 RepID=UPI001C014E96|nr:hypothetical protein [Geobacter grbiciae]MBT1075837.1 hypothetical protein [Geobacter grbiciae]
MVITTNTRANDQPATRWIVRSVVLVDCLPNRIIIVQTAAVPSTRNKILTKVLIAGDMGTSGADYPDSNSRLSGAYQ